MRSKTGFTLRLSESVSIVAAARAASGKKSASVAAMSLARVSIVLVALGCAQSASPPAQTGGSGGEGGVETGGSSGSGPSGGTAGSVKPDAAPDLAIPEDTARPADALAPDLAAADGLPATAGLTKIVLFAGGGAGGDGSPAAMAKLSEPFGVAQDPMTGDFYIAEFTDHVRKIDAKGILTTVVGTGATGPGGQVQLTQPHDVLFRPGTRTLFIADTYANRVLKMDAATGDVVPFAGAGTQVA